MSDSVRSVTVKEFKDDNGRRRALRLDVDSIDVAESVEIDGARDEMRAVGLTFHPLRDTSGAPVGLVLSDDDDADAEVAEAAVECSESGRKSTATR